MKACEVLTDCVAHVKMDFTDIYVSFIALFKNKSCKVLHSKSI